MLSVVTCHMFERQMYHGLHSWCIFHEISMFFLSHIILNSRVSIKISSLQKILHKRNDLIVCLIKIKNVWVESYSIFPVQVLDAQISIKVLAQKFPWCSTNCHAPPSTLFKVIPFKNQLMYFLKPFSHSPF